MMGMVVIFVSINEKMGALSIGPVSLKQSMRCSLSCLVSVLFSMSESLVGTVASGEARRGLMSLLIMSLPVIASYGWSLAIDVLLLYRLMICVILELAPVMSRQCQCLCGSSIESVLIPTILFQHVNMPPLRGVAVESVIASRLLFRACKMAWVSVSERVV
jgi:hypothetical protein